MLADCLIEHSTLSAIQLFVGDEPGVYNRQGHTATAASVANWRQGQGLLLRREEEST